MWGAYVERHAGGWRAAVVKILSADTVIVYLPTRHRWFLIAALVAFREAKRRNAA